MTMLIGLDSGNRASLRSLFDGYPCLHGVVAAVIEGGMGRVFADAQAVAVGGIPPLLGRDVISCATGQPLASNCQE